MSDNPKQNTETIRPLVFEIRIKGHINEQWTDWFGGLTITPDESGDTLLTGPILDQAALYGLLRKVRDLGLPLISVNCIDSGVPDGPASKV